MTIPYLVLPVAFVFLLPLSAMAQPDDGAYCRALVAEYQKYYVKTSGHTPRSGTPDGNVAAEQCAAGNTAGIPVLEQKLRNARVPLPPRG